MEHNTQHTHTERTQHPTHKDMVNSMMSDPAIPKQYKEAMNNPDIQRMQMRLMQSPDFLQKIEEMRKDPEMAAVFQELETGGMEAMMMKYYNEPPEAMMKYYNDPIFSKLSHELGFDDYTELEAEDRF